MKASRNIEKRIQLAVFDTHPIQYRSPVFRSAFKRMPGFQVWFFNEDFDGNKWWFHEKGKIPVQPFSLPLREGFPNEVLHTGKMGLVKIYQIISDLICETSPAAIALYGYYLPEHWIVRLLARKNRIPLIFIGETFSPGSSFLRRVLKKPLQKYFFSGVERFIAIGHRTQSYYQALGICPEKIISAKYCVDVDFFHLSKEQSKRVRMEWRKRNGVPEKAFVLLFVGRLFERKRPEDMLALHDILNKKYAHVFTVIVGNGPMESEIREKSSKKKNVIMAGFRNQVELREFYHASDLLVVPSEYETWGLVVNEAFASEKPAIVTHTCGVAEDLVISGRTGYVYNMGKPEQAAGQIEILVKAPEKLSLISEQAYEMVSGHYSVDQFAEALEKVTGYLVQHQSSEAVK